MSFLIRQRRFRMMFGIVGALALVFALACEEENGDPTPPPAASQTTLEKVQEQGYVTIGFANEAPYGFADETGQVTGEAPEVAKEVLSRMGVDEVVGVVTPFGSLIPGLQAGRFDMIAAGMFINPDRCSEILFSDPDYAVPQAFGVESGNPHGLMNFKDVAANSDVTLGVMAGAVEATYATEQGVPEDQLVLFDDAPSLVEGLQAGRVDAFALTTLSVKEQIERVNDPDLEMTPGFTPVINGEPKAGAGGYGFRQSDTAFHEEFNEILGQMKQNDEILPIVEPFGFGPDEVNAAKDLTAEQLCSAA